MRLLIEKTLNQRIMQSCKKTGRRGYNAKSKGSPDKTKSESTY